MPWNKTDRAFKTLINKRTTDSDGKFFFNERGDFTINTHQDELWVDPIPSTPPGVSTDTVLVYNTLTLVEDLSVPSKAGWFATSNASTVPAQTDETSRLKDWISDKYGTGYEAVLYDKDDIQIPPSDGCGWFFDYQTGILTFASTTTTTGPGGSLSTRAGSTGFKIKAYRYVGRKGLDGNVVKNDVRVATTSGTSFSGWTYDGANERIDTGVTSATLTIDGVNLSSTLGSAADRVLIKNWSTLSNNGIYYVERAGDGASTSWRLRRAQDFDSSEDIFAGAMVFVREGSTQARTVWSMTNSSFTTMDAVGATGEVTFGQYIGGAFTAGSGLNLSGTTIAANVGLDNSVSDRIRFVGGSGSNNSASAGGSGTTISLNVVRDAGASGDQTLALTALATGFSLAGGQTSRTLTVTGTTTLAGGGNTLTIANTGNVTITNNTGEWVLQAGTTTPRSLTLNGGNATIVGNGTTLTLTGDLTASTAGTISLNSQTLTLTGSTANVTLTPQGTTATTYNLVSSGSTQWMLSFSGGAFSVSTGAVFYAQSTFNNGVGATSGSSTQVLRGGTTPSFGAVNLATMVSGTLPLANGGTNANLTAVNGGIVYSTASAMAISSAGTSSQVFTSGGAGAPSWQDVASLLTQGVGISITGTTNATVAFSLSTNITGGNAWTGNWEFRGNSAGTVFAVQNSGTNVLRVITTSGQQQVALGADSPSATDMTPISTTMYAAAAIEQYSIVRVVQSSTTGHHNRVQQVPIDTTGDFVGVAMNSASSAGDPIRVAIAGRVFVLVEEASAVAIGDYLIAGSETDGYAESAGTTRPAVGYIGRALTTKAAESTGGVYMLIEPSGSTSTGTVTGTGSATYIPVWTGASAQATSAIYQNTSNNDATQVNFIPSTASNSILLNVGNTNASAVGRLTFNADNVAGSTTAGIINLPASTSSARGIAFGTDLLYRSNPSVGNGLRTNIGLVADTIIGAGLSGSVHQFQVSSAGSITIVPQSAGVANNITVKNFNSADDTSGTAVARLRIRKSDDSVNLFEVDSAGNLRAITKEFVIPHPTMPGHQLAHGCLEGPEHGAYFRGSASGRGRVRVETPPYWSKLVGGDYTVSLTPLCLCRLYVCDKDETGFTVAAAGPLARLRKVSFDWMAVGARLDAPLKVVRPVQG